MSKKLGVLLIILVVTAGAGWYFKDALIESYIKGVQEFKETDFNEIITEIKREVLTPPPLNIGGRANNVVLVKSAVIAETNLHRQNNGLPALKENTTLNVAAKAKAEDMFNKQYFDHVSPSGVGPADLVKSFGYDYIITGENLILGNFKDEKEVVQLWMDSPGHRANIVNNRYTEIGVAVVKGTYKGETVWIGVQEFGLPLASCPQPDTSVKAKIEANKDTLESLSVQIDAKRAELEATSRRSERYNELVDEYNQLVNQYNALNNDTKDLIALYNSQINTFNACVSGE